ncbi:hypothetical protein [Streptomyces nigrescens]|uniref:hypothetical protein n=1 Tax=Streptomyces nigrescens TaxID=1920 RepID=UPI003497A479
MLATDLLGDAIYQDDAELGMTVHWWKLSEAGDAVRVGRIAEYGSVAGLLLAAHAQGWRPLGDRLSCDQQLRDSLYELVHGWR